MGGQSYPHHHCHHHQHQSWQCQDFESLCSSNSFLTGVSESFPIDQYQICNCAYDYEQRKCKNLGFCVGCREDRNCRSGEVGFDFCNYDYDDNDAEGVNDYDDCNDHERDDDHQRCSSSGVCVRDVFDGPYDDYLYDCLNDHQ